MKQNIRIFIARYKFIWLLTSMILLTLSAQAQQANHEKVLQHLDEVITKKASFRTERETTISQLKQQLHYATTEEDKYKLFTLSSRLSSVLYKQKIGICTIIK